ncbi:MAG: DUF3658 domain-containing protein [Tahibacter sp.]
MDRPDEMELENPQLSPEEVARIAALTPAEIQAIDADLLAGADVRWRKVARLVATAMMAPRHPSAIPDIYYALRIRVLVSSGALNARGKLSRMRYSEVRLPTDGSDTHA